MRREASPLRAGGRGDAAVRSGSAVAWVLGVVAMAVLGARPTAAAELRWTAPAGCPSEAAVQQRLHELLGEEALRSDVTADGQVRREGERWVLELSLRDAARSSTRRMSARDCETLAQAAALVLATFVEPLAAATRVEQRARRVVVPTVPPQTRSSTPVSSAPPRVEGGSPGQPPASADARGPRPPDRFGLRLGAVVGRATQADVDLGPELTLSWQRGAARLAVGALALIPRRQPVPAPAGAELRQWLLAGGLRAGLVVPLAPRLWMPLSAGVELGPLVARGEGIARPRTAVAPWLAVVGSAHAVWRPQPRWGLWVGITGVAGVLLPQFTVAGSSPLVVGRGGLRGSVGGEWRWG